MAWDVKDLKYSTCLNDLDDTDELKQLNFRFDLRKQAQPISALKFDEGQAPVAGEVTAIDDNSYGRRPAFKTVIRDDTGAVQLIWFGCGYLRDVIKEGAQLAISGKPNVYREQVQFVNP